MIQFVVGVDVHFSTDVEILGNGTEDVDREKDVAAVIGTEADTSAKLRGGSAIGAESIVHVPNAVECKSVYG